MSEECTERLTALEATADLAVKLIGQKDQGLAAAQWQRLLLGKLTELLLDDESRLTGAELRGLLGVDPPGPRTKAPSGDAKLPPQFADVVRQIYGVNLQTDIGPPTPPDNGEQPRADGVNIGRV